MVSYLRKPEGSGWQQLTDMFLPPQFRSDHLQSIVLSAMHEPSDPILQYPPGIILYCILYLIHANHVHAARLDR